MSDPSKKIEGEIDRFDDIFHSYGDDIDEDEDADIDFNQFFTNFDKNDDDDEHQDSIPVEINPTTEAEEQHLSQKLSQLSASETVEPPSMIVVVNKRPATTPTTPPSKATLKKLRTEVDDLPNDDIPKYLSRTEKTFETTMNPLLQQAAAAATTADRITMEDLRQLAVLQHKLEFIKLKTLLWTTYLRSGTGKLIQDQEQQWPITRTRYLSMWPSKLKSIIDADPHVHPEAKKNIGHDTYLNYVHQMLHQFREQTMDYQTQLIERKQQQQQQQRFHHGLTLEMEEAIENFVEQYGITFHRILIEGQITVINYDYRDRLIESDFSYQNPYAEQIKVFENLVQGKLNKEISKMEVQLLKQRVAHHQLSSIFDSFRIPPPSALETIEDPGIQQRLTDEYQQLIKRTKSEMMILHIQTAEAKMDENEQKFETDMKQFNQNQRTGFSDEKFTTAMSDLLEQRLKNIDERFEILYNLKVRFFVKAPTVVNKN